MSIAILLRTRDTTDEEDAVQVNGPVAQWIRHRPTEPGIAGSSPAGVNLIEVLLATTRKCETRKLAA